MSFTEWFDRGFTDLLPVVPPGADLSPLSKIPVVAMGKVPGRQKANGQWAGDPEWLTRKATREMCEQWDRWYEGTPSIGLRAARFPAVDIDVTDSDLSDMCYEVAQQALGPTAERYRDGTPKALLAYRTAEPFRRMRLWFEKDGQKHLVEVLGSQNHYLIEGEHPSGGVYQWDAVGGADTVPLITAEQADAMLTTLAAALTAVGCTDLRREGGTRLADRAEPAPAILRGDMDEVIRLVRAIPNTDALFPSRDDYLTMGYAIKAAVGEAGYDLWLEWGQRWENTAEQNYPDVMAADWSRMTPPFAVGIDWLRDKARGAGVDTASDDFSALPPEAPYVPPIDAEALQSGAVAYSDAWVAARFLQRHGHEVRFCGSLGGWLRWDGSKWAPDTLNVVSGWVAQACREAGRHGMVANPGRAGETIALRCGSDRMWKSVLSYAAVKEGVNVASDVFDADPWLLNTPDGYVDLRTGERFAPDASKLFTCCTAVAPRPGKAGRWEQFLHEVTNGDPALNSYLARLVGYALTGSTRENAFAFLWGPGGNGKGVFLNTLVRAFGSYAAVAAMDTFTSSRNDRHPTDLAGLRGARLVTAQETQEGRSWDEAKIKSITGGDPISARFMRGDFFTYLPRFTLLFSGNHEPKIHTADDAMRRRVHLVPFTHRPKALNTRLTEELAEELPQILDWAVQGAQAWLAEGLNPPAIVLAATASYFEDHDSLGRWLEEATVPEEGTGAPESTLYATWRRWCHEQNEPPGTQQAFVKSVAARGYARRGRGADREVVGLTLRPDIPVERPGRTALFLQ